MRSVAGESVLWWCSHRCTQRRQSSVINAKSKRTDIIFPPLPSRAIVTGRAIATDSAGRRHPHAGLHGL